MSQPDYLRTPDMRLALKELRRPFTPAAIRFKVQMAKRSSPVNEKDYAMVVSYIDARLVIERLNLVVGGGWHDRLFSGGLCELTVLGVTRTDSGEAQGLAATKALHSDSLKRAAVKFGVGVSVYAAPRIVLTPTKKRWLRPVTSSKGLSWALTQSGEHECRRRYAEWLKKVGVKQFGEPLDHGDVEASQGDWEIEQEQSVVVSTTDLTTPAGPARMVDIGTVVALTDEELGALAADLDANGVSEQDIALLCASVGVDDLECLTQASLGEFRQELEKHLAGVGS